MWLDKIKGVNEIVLEGLENLKNQHIPCKKSLKINKTKSYATKIGKKP